MRAHLYCYALGKLWTVTTHVAMAPQLGWMLTFGRGAFEVQHIEFTLPAGPLTITVEAPPIFESSEECRAAWAEVPEGELLERMQGASR